MDSTPHKVEIDILPENIRELLGPIIYETEKVKGIFVLQVYSTGHAKGLYLPPEQAEKAIKFFKPLWEEAEELS